MGKFGALLFHFSIFILTLSFSCQATDEDRKAYIVYMGALPGGVYSPSTHHLSVLQGIIQSSSIADSFIRSYKRSFNGFAAKLTDHERQKLASMKGVISVFPSENFQTQTTRSWDFMGLHETIDRQPTVESDAIIGVIDTGIWPELESFSDKGFSPPPKKWKGVCKGGANFTCNNKIIGTRFYASFSPLNSASARDDVGHGTHTASTAAGNRAKGASFYGIAKGTARGGVPSARIAAYKVCDPDGCYSHSILAAFDDAIADGVDIISVSLGHDGPQSFHQDPIAIGSFHAMVKGILTLHSAGNNGPDLGSVSSLAPWLMTVAASSIDRRIISKGSSVNPFRLKGKTFPLVHGRNASTQCSNWRASMCDKGCLDTHLVKGKIVLCDQAAGIKEAYRAGAVGSISADARFNDVSFLFPLPAVALNQTGYEEVILYLNSTDDPRATILKSEVIKDSAAPVVVSFSSRGPNVITPDILKPDISAPGVDILASYSPVCPPSSSPEDTRRVKYNIMSGTSMACPHVAGVAAYVKTFHPEWSPSAIKSSLMTTALVMNSTKDPNKEFDHGSGHVNPVEAINPGLVFESSEVDYIAFLCSIGYDDRKVALISGHNSTCPKTSEAGSPRYLNYPSMAAEVPADKPFTVSFRRRVTNVGGKNATYTAKIFPESKLDIKVTPAVLSFKSLGEEKSFVVIVKGRGLSENSIVSTSVVWSDGTHNVRIPIVLQNLKLGQMRTPH